MINLYFFIYNFVFIFFLKGFNFFLKMYVFRENFFFILGYKVISKFILRDI